MSDLDMRRYLPADSREDAVPAISRALADARALPDPVLRFPPGVWHLWPDRAFERHLFISNHDAGLKRLAFPLAGFNGLEIAGDRTEFRLHGRVLPFAIEDCRRVTLRGITLDTDRSFFSQGLVAAAGPDWVELEMDRASYPFEAVPGELIFKGANWTSEPDTILLLTEFDPVRKEPAWRSRHTQVRMRDLAARETPEGRLCFHAKFHRPCTPGNQLVMVHEKRHCPAIFVSRSEDVLVEDVTIYQAGAMGLIVQLTRNVTVRRLSVCLRPGTERMVSTNGDATHFVHCSGAILIEDGVFENMMDDAVNIHGMYAVVTGLPGPRELELRLMHRQQAGIPILGPGDRLAITERATLMRRSQITAVAVEAINSHYLLVAVEEPLEGRVVLGDAVENVSRMPSEVVIRRCRSGRNRPRGFLLTAPGRARVEDCEFHNAQHGIHIGGDASY